MFTDYERDQLREIVNLGASKAADALAQLIGKKVKVEVPIVHLDTIERLAAQMGDPGAIITAILMKINGEAPGVVFLFFPRTSAEHIASLMTSNHKKEINVLDSFDRSALQEVGNILVGSSLAALAKFSDLSFVQSVPEVVTDNMGAIFNSILLELGGGTEAMLLLNVKIEIEEDGKGDLFFFFDDKATTKLLSAVEKKLIS